MVLLHDGTAIAQLLWSRRLQHGVLAHVGWRVQLRWVQRWWPKRRQVGRRIQLLLIDQRRIVRLLLVQQQRLRQHGRRQVLRQRRINAGRWRNLPVAHLQLTTDCSCVQEQTLWSAACIHLQKVANYAKARQTGHSTR